jgi:hypothetical protein
LQKADHENGLPDVFQITGADAAVNQLILGILRQGQPAQNAQAGSTVIPVNMAGMP